MRFQFWLLVGALSGGVSVALGALGAHWLEGWLDGRFDAEQAARRLDVWQTAAQYQMYHALALVAVGLAAARWSSAAMMWAGGAFVAGTLLFSGCLYLYVLTDVRGLVHVVPVGGTLFIVGWVFLAAAVTRLDVSKSQG